MKTKLFCLLTILLFAVSCKDDFPQMLVLHIPQQIDNSIILNWEQSEIPGFRYYMVMRASDGKNYNVINDITAPTSDAFRKEITTFTDNTYPLEVDTLYYKIMAVGNETVSSKNVFFRNESKVHIVKGNVIDIHCLEDMNRISVITYDYNYERKLRVFDMQSGLFLPNEATIDLSSSGCWYLWGKYNGKTEFFNYDSDWTMYVYDAATARLITSLRTPSYVWYDSYTTNNKGMIYIYSSRLYLLNRETGTTTQYQPINHMYWADFLHYDSNNNKLYAIDEMNYGRIITFNFNSDGSVASDDAFIINENSGTPIFIENSSLFIVNTNGQWKILNMNTQMYYPIEWSFTSGYYSSETKAVLANNNIYFYNGSNKIFQISTTDYKIVKTHILRTEHLKQMVVANSYLYYLGYYYNDGYLLNKIKL